MEGAQLIGRLSHGRRRPGRGRIEPLLQGVEPFEELRPPGIACPEGRFEIDNCQPDGGHTDVLDAAEQTVHDAIAVQEAGAFAVVMEMVPAELATQITGKLTIPTVGIGAGPNCDAQVLVWQDMAGMTHGRTAKFVKRFGAVGDELRRAAVQYAEEVAAGVFPAEEHSF